MVLDEREFRRILDFAAEVSVLADVDTLGDVVVDRLPLLVRCEQIAFNEVDPVAGRTTWTVRPWSELADDTAAWFARHAHQHPVIAHYMRTRDGRPRTISDFMTPEQFHKTALYEHLYARLGAEDQLSCTLPLEAPLLVGIALNRTSRDFSARDREVLNLIRPHVLAAYRNAQVYTRLRSTIANLALAADGLVDGLVVLDRRGRIEYATPHAAALLDHWLGAETDDALQQMRQRPANRPGSPLNIRRGDDALQLRVLPGAINGCDLLVVSQVAGRAQAAALVGLGLTPRQAEVLALVASGKNNKEIASHLTVSVLTVKKHLESIYNRLGVRNRVDAALVATNHTGINRI